MTEKEKLEDKEGRGSLRKAWGTTRKETMRESLRSKGRLKEERGNNGKKKDGEESYIAMGF